MADRRVYHPDDAARFYAQSAGRPYRPSNGTEGEIFEAAWCDHCRRDAAFRRFYDSNGAVGGDQPDGCAILCSAHAFDIGDDGYPSEWVYGPDGQPRCTAFSDEDAPPVGERCCSTVDLFAASPTEARHG